MAGVLMDDGAKKALDLLTAGITIKLDLYKSNHTPDRSTDNLATYTAIKADFSGYTPGQTTAGWTAAAMVGARATSNATLVTSTHNGGATGNTVYGYYLWFTVSAVDYLLAAELAPTPFTINAAGQRYEVTPQLTDKSEF